MPTVAVTGDVTDEADNCDTSLDATYADVVTPGACEGEEIITRTWTLTDDCGNTTQHVQVITAKDNTAPTFTAPANITIYKDASCNFDASLAVTGDVTDEADNCDTSLDATYGDVVTPGACEGEEIITRTWTLTDDCGNTTQHVQVITAKDNTAPTFTAPADITIYKDASATYNASLAVTGDVTDEADNCDTSLDATYADVVTPGACEGEEIITRTWTLTDDCGNTTQHVQVITAEDNTAPTFTAPADITIYKDATCAYNANVSVTGDVTDEADNCDTSLDATYVDVVTPGACEGEEIITRTWTLTDDCGNTTQHVQVITAEDNTAPTFTAPANITIYKDASCNFDASLAVTGDVTDEADNCDTSLDATYADVVTPGACEGEEIITRTWTLTDDCGNTTQHVQVITAEDNTAPTFTAPADITIYKDASCNFDASLAVTGDVTDEADNCDTSLDATYGDVVTPGACEGEEIITRTWTLIDDCGNTTRHIQVITAKDTISPDFTVPADITLCRTVSCTFDASPLITGDVTDETDNCSTGINAVYTDDLSNLINCDTAGYIIRKWTLTDKCGNTTNKSQVITIEPTPKVSASPSIDTTCNGGTVNITLTSITHPTRPVLFRFDTQVPFGLSVAPANGTAIANGSILTETFVNNTDTAKQVVFTITPYTREAASESEKCSGVPVTVRVWVEPTPRVELTPSQDTICTSLNTLVHFSSVTRSVQPVKFYYEARYNPALVSVYYAKDTFDLDPGFPMIDSVVNRTSVPQVVTFIAYPYLNGPAGMRKCPGIPDSTVIWIAPELHVMVDSISRYIGGKNIRCRNDSSGFVSLTPQGGVTAFTGYDVYDLSYTWNNGQTSRSLSNLEAGSYHINISDHFGCRDDSLIVLTQPDSILTTSIIIVHPVSCYGKDGILQANTKGGTRGYDNIWIQVPKDFGEPAPIHRDMLTDASEGRYILQVFDTNMCTTIMPAVWRDMTQPPAKSVGAYPINYGSYQLKCHGDSTGSWVTVNNSMTSITYHWTGPGIDSTFTNASQLNYQYNLKAGNYKLVYTDESNCRGELPVSLEEPDSLVIEKSTLSSYYGLYNVSCFGRSDGQINLNSIRGGHIESDYTFSWTSLSGGSLADSTLRNQSGLEAGTYSVVVSDTFNCVAGETFDLIQPSEIKSLAEVSQSLSGGNNLNCYGDSSGFIVLHPEGGDVTKAPYQFQWQHGGSSSELRNLKAGDYMVTITDGINCSIKDTITIDQPVKLQIDSVRISDHNGFAVSCFDGGDASIRIYGNGGAGNYDYNWSADNIALTRDTSYIDNLSTGSYKLDLTDANNCIVAWTGTLESPDQLILRFENTNVNCTGTEKGSTRALVTGGISAYSYLWETGETDQSRAGLDTGRYGLTVTDRNLCQITDTSVILQNPSVQVSISVTDSISCHNDLDGQLTAVVSSGIAPYTYKWSNNLPTETISAGRGSYSVTVTDADQCFGTGTIILDDPDHLAAMADITVPKCFGYTDGSVTLAATGGTPGYIYYWNNVLVDGTFIDQLMAGSYNLRIKDRRECSHDTVILIKEPEPLKLSFDEINTVAPFCPDWQNGALAIRVTGGSPVYEFNWTDYPDESDSILNDIRENTYEVEVTDIQGCKAEGTFNLKAVNSSCLGIPTAFTPNYDFANDTWEINYINEDGGEANFHEIYPNGVIEVYDRLGSLVYRCTGGCPEQWNGEDLKGRPLPVDSYYFIIQLNNEKDTPPIKGNVTIIK